MERFQKTQLLHSNLSAQNVFQELSLITVIALALQHGWVWTDLSRAGELPWGSQAQAGTTAPRAELFGDAPSLPSLWVSPSFLPEHLKLEALQAFHPKQCMS